MTGVHPLSVMLNGPRYKTAASSVAMDAFRRMRGSHRLDIQKMLPAGRGLMLKIGVTTKEVDKGDMVRAILGFA
jgi:hypothetical protein